MSHEINGIRLYVCYWTRDENFEIGKNSRSITKTFDGVSCSDVMNQYGNFIYSHDLNKYTPAQIVDIEEL